MNALSEMNAVAVAGRTKRATVPLLFLHGIGNGAWVWESVQEHVAALGYSSWAVDLPGHGADVGSNPSLVDIQSRVVSAVKEFDDSVCVIGHSMGALVAQMVASQVKLHSMVLMCSAPPKEVRPRLRTRHVLPGIRRAWPLMKGDHLDFRGKAYRELGFNCVEPHRIEAIEEQLTPWPNQLARELFLSRPSVAPAPCPVLVVSGQEDRLISSQTVQRIAAYHDDAVALHVEGVGHFPQLEPGASRLMERVLEWVAAVK